MAIGNSTKAAEISKWREWKKTREGRDFPLTVNGNGQWIKKVKGKPYYFGVLSDRQAALDEWLRCKDDILAGRGKPPKMEGMTVSGGCNLFLESREKRLEAGELSQGMWREYKRTSEKLVAHFGRLRPVESLRPTDFSGFADALKKTRSGRGLTNVVMQTRTIFKWLYEMEHIEKPVRFGDGFRGPTKAALRKRKAKEPPKFFDRGELLLMLNSTELLGVEVAKQWKALILLGVNGGLGCTDFSNVEFRHLDLDEAILDFPREKNGATRIVALWPETVKAIREYLRERPEPLEGLEDIVFLNTRGYYWTWRGSADIARHNGGDRTFRKLRQRLKLNSTNGNNYYGLRRTFRTVVDSHPDKHAIRLTMGHVSTDIGEDVYCQFIESGRLRSVAEHVRKWLFYAPCEKCGEPVHAWHQAEHKCPEGAENAGEGGEA